jgi:hypothetical protein
LVDKLLNQIISFNYDAFFESSQCKCDEACTDSDKNLGKPDLSMVLVISPFFEYFGAHGIEVERRLALVDVVSAGVDFWRS